MSDFGLSFFDLDLRRDHSGLLAQEIAMRFGESLLESLRSAKLFVMSSRWAPGFHCVGGTISLGGQDTLDVAIWSFLGEALERQCQFERPGDIAASGSWSEVALKAFSPLALLLQSELSQHVALTDRALDWVAGTAYFCDSASRSVLLPADWCLRRPDDRQHLSPTTALSTGTAAGPDRDWSASRALLELMERDAASLWWVGGKRSRSIPLDDPSSTEVVRPLATLRSGVRDRRTFLLEIGTDIDIPVVAAWSCLRDGKAFACGVAARVSMAEAMRCALFGLCQMEVGYLLAATKAESGGRATPTSTDRLHIERARSLDANCLLLHPRGIARTFATATPGPALPTIVAALSRAGIDFALFEHTRPEFPISVVRACAPDLQLMPSTLTTARLAEVIAQTGGTKQQCGGIALM